MTFREVLRKFLRRSRELLDNKRAEGNIAWIDDVLYFIEGKHASVSPNTFPTRVSVSAI